MLILAIGVFDPVDGFEPVIINRVRQFEHSVFKITFELIFVKIIVGLNIRFSKLYRKLHMIVRDEGIKITVALLHVVHHIVIIQLQLGKNRIAGRTVRQGIILKSIRNGKGHPSVIQHKKIFIALGIGRSPQQNR